MGKVAVVMGSASDLPVAEKAVAVLREYEVPVEVRVLSAHRCPDEAREFAASARESGFSCLIAAAGMAAHLAGALAANCTLPVIGIPCGGGAFSGMDALLSTVQMPFGIPVAAVAVDGAKNAALLAIQNSRTVHGVYTAQDFHTVAVSWDGRLLVLRGGGEVVGFCITSDTGRIGELALRDESLLHDALCAVQQYLGCDVLTLPCAGWDTARMQEVGPLYDRFALFADDKYQVFDYPAVAAFFLQAKAAQRPLPGGRLTLSVDGGQPFALTLQNGRADAAPCDTADYNLTHAEAMALLFSPEGLIRPQVAAPAGWLPLPLYVDSPDKC